MKILVAVYSMFLFITATGQANLDQQMQLIVKDAPSYFQHLRKRFMQLHGTDSVFFSSIDIKGTKKNRISFGEFNAYIAPIADSISEEKARKLIEEWKNKLSVVLNDFTVSAIVPGEKNPRLYGWKLTKGLVTINLTAFPRPDEIGKSIAILSIAYQ